MALKNGGKLPVEYEVQGGTVAKNFDTTITRNTELPSIKDQNFLVSFQRSSGTRILTYIMALVPLILALIFLHLLFFSTHAHTRDFEEYPEALIVTIVAVLPLRIVLVPPEITGLTRVDLLLGVGLIVIVAIAGWKYASEVWAFSGRAAPAHTHVHEEVPAEPQTHAAPAGGE
jgi:hypothetical protein